MSGLLTTFGGPELTLGRSSEPSKGLPHAKSLVWAQNSGLWSALFYRYVAAMVFNVLAR
jgi:hypothetical protein